MSDLIERQAAVEKILRNKDAKPLNESDYQDGIRAGLDIAYCEIRDMPSAEPVRGEWLVTEAYPHNVYCSVCHKTYAQTHWAIWNDENRPLPRRFCPNCGAKMEYKQITGKLKKR